MSFLRHADLSPDGHSTQTYFHQGKDTICPSSGVTHRYDESGRVFLASCSPAEPASAFSARPMCQTMIRRSKRITANGILLLSSLSQSRGQPHAIFL